MPKIKVYYYVNVLNSESLVSIYATSKKESLKKLNEIVHFPNHYEFIGMR